MHSRYTHRSSALPGGILGSSIPVSGHWRLLDPPLGEGRQTSRQPTGASTPRQAVGPHGVMALIEGMVQCTENTRLIILIDVVTDNVDKTLQVKWSDKVCPNHQANQQMFFSQTPVKAVRLQTCVLCGMPVYRPTYFLSTKLHNLMTEAMWCEKLPNGLHAVVGNRTRTAQMQVRFTIIVHHHAILWTQHNSMWIITEYYIHTPTKLKTHHRCFSWVMNTECGCRHGTKLSCGRTGQHRRVVTGKERRTTIHRPWINSTSLVAGICKWTTFCSVYYLVNSCQLISRIH